MHGSVKPFILSLLGLILSIDKVVTLIMFMTFYGSRYIQGWSFYFQEQIKHHTHIFLK